MRESMDFRNGKRWRRAFLARLIRELREVGSWTGETHIQTSMFYLERMLGCVQGYRFYFYCHGPYSRDVWEVMQFMSEYGEIVAESQPRYRPRYQLTDAGRELADEFEYGAEQIEWISQYVGEKSVTPLEGPSTALFLMLQDPKRSESENAAELHRLRPHIPLWAAHVAIQDARDLRQRAEEDGVTLTGTPVGAA